MAVVSNLPKRPLHSTLSLRDLNILGGGKKKRLTVKWQRKKFMLCCFCVRLSLSGACLNSSGSEAGVYEKENSPCWRNFVQVYWWNSVYPCRLGKRSTLLGCHLGAWVRWSLTLSLQVARRTAAQSCLQAAASEAVPFPGQGNIPGQGELCYRKGCFLVRSFPHACQLTFRSWRSALPEGSKRRERARREQELAKKWKELFLEPCGKRRGVQSWFAQ